MQLSVLAIGLVWHIAVVQSQPLPLLSKPANDRCATAEFFTIGASSSNLPILVNLANATADKRGIDVPLNTSCYYSEFGANFEETDPGLWYTFVGTGGAVAIELATQVGGGVHMMDSIVDFAVFKGASCSNTNSINALQCVTSFVLSTTNNRGGFVFKTESSAVTYRMLVKASVSDEDIMAKRTTVAFVTRKVPQLELAPNDDCVNAVSLSPGTFVRGNTSLATSDEANVSGECEIPWNTFDSKVSYRRQGVWYKIVGMGRKVVISSDAVMVVYKGASCNDATSRTCALVKGRVGGRLPWYTEANVNYYIVLWNDNPFFKNYFIDVVEPQPPNDVNNDLCSKALPVQLGVTFEGNLRHAAYQIDKVAPQSTCDIQPSPGLWYSFVGIDGVVTPVMSCRSADDVWNGAATVHVYAGSCLGASSGNIWEPSIQLQCISTMTVRTCDTVPFGIATKTGVTYYLLVQAQATNYAFNMTLLPTRRSTSAAAFPANDVCAKASPLAVGATTVMRNNFTLATSDEKDVTDDCSCGNVTRVSSRGLWFSFVDTGNKLWADVCGGSTPELVKQVSIYKGASCGSLKCVAGSDAPCPYPYVVPQLFLFDTEVGTTYYMLVQNRQGEIPRGEPPSSIFNVAIKDAPLPPVNDVCSKATPTSIGSTLAGDLALATSDHDEVSAVCGNNGNVYGNAYSMSNPPLMPGVWFRFVGMGGNVRVTSNCATGYSTTNIHVYKATTTASSLCGSSLQCVTGFGSYCDLEGGTTYYNVFNFTADAGSTYYLLVRKSALGDTSGKFEVQLESIATGAFDKFPIESVVPKRCVVTPPSPIAVVRPSPVPVIPPSPAAAVPPSTALSPRSPTGQDPSIGSGPVPAPTPAASGPGAPNPAPMTPQSSPLPQSPSQSSAPVQRPKCRRLGCRIRRLLRAIFGIFT